MSNYMNQASLAEVTPIPFPDPPVGAEWRSLDGDTFVLVLTEKEGQK